MVTEFSKDILPGLGQIVKSCSKMHQAAMFIDFFIHDILDYTILSKDEANF
jgi:hypothetical protein